MSVRVCSLQKEVIRKTQTEGYSSDKQKAIVQTEGYSSDKCWQFYSCQKQRYSIKRTLFALPNRLDPEYNRDRNLIYPFFSWLLQDSNSAVQ